MAKKRKEDHPFYCYAKSCRKSAWDTPEFLSKEEWEFLRDKAIPAVESLDHILFMTTIYEDRAMGEMFFMRAIGWVEGHSYCHNARYTELTAMDGLQHDLPKLKKAVWFHFLPRVWDNKVLEIFDDCRSVSCDGCGDAVGDALVPDEIPKLANWIDKHYLCKNSLDK
jgi:hypothetical protein